MQFIVKLFFVTTLYHYTERVVSTVDIVVQFYKKSGVAFVIGNHIYVVYFLFTATLYVYIVPNAVSTYFRSPVPTEMTLSLAHEHTFFVKDCVVSGRVYLVHCVQRAVHFHCQRIVAFV